MQNFILHELKCKLHSFKIFILHGELCLWCRVSMSNYHHRCPGIYSQLYPRNCGPGNSSGKALAYGLDGLGFILGVRGVEIYLHSFMSRLDLGSTRPPKNEYQG